MTTPLSIPRRVLEMHRVLSEVEVAAPQEPKMLKYCDHARVHITGPTERIGGGVEVDGRAESVHGEVRVATDRPERKDAVPRLDGALETAAAKFVEDSFKHADETPMTLKRLDRLASAANRERERGRTRGEDLPLPTRQTRRCD